MFADLFRYETVSVHFGADRSSLDLDVGAIDPAQLGEAERRANEIVWENRPVSVGFEDSSTATGLRKPPPRAGTLRVVTIAELDRSLRRTHVRATGEIGAITLRGTERVRKQTRIDFLCGVRVVRQARADFEALSAIALSVKASITEAPALVAAQIAELRDALSARKRLEGEVAVHQARALYDMTGPTRAASAWPSFAVMAGPWGSSDRSRRRSLHCRRRCSLRRWHPLPRCSSLRRTTPASMPATPSGWRSPPRQAKVVDRLDWHRAPSLTRMPSRAS